MPLQCENVFAIDGVTPVVDPTAFVHPTAVIIGDVIVEAGCYIGPCASLRGDFGRILVGRGSNIQDNCTLHSLPGYDSVIGENGHVGHGAIVHSARLAANVLIGMNSVVMDHAEIGEAAIVAAMSFVKVGAKVPPRWLWGGIPAKGIRELTDAEVAGKSAGTAAYRELALRSLATMTRVVPLPAAEPERRRVDAALGHVRTLDSARSERSQPE